LKRGGFVFDGNDADAKNGLRIALGKDNQIGKLPNGTYGLNAWYGERFTSRRGKGNEPAATAQSNGVGEKPAPDEKE
jgi:hypothetical protein